MENNDKVTLANSVMVIDKQDVLAAVERIFNSTPKPDDLTTLRAMLVLAEGLLDGPLPTIKAD